MNIEWLNNAKTDLLTLFAFYESKSAIAAVKMYNGIIEEVEILATQLQSAKRIVPLFKTNCTKKQAPFGAFPIYLTNLYSIISIYFELRFNVTWCVFNTEFLNGLPIRLFSSNHSHRSIKELLLEVKKM